jgi:type I restriction enzyme, S subunit
MQGIASSNATLVPEGSIVVSTRAPIGYVAELSVSGATNQGCRSLIPRQQLESRYFRYQLRAARSYLESRGQGTTFIELSTEGLAGATIVVPPLEIQRSIADFLDAETLRIDDLVIKKRRMLDLVRAQFDLLVRHTLDDPNWPRLPLKRRWTVIDCKHRTPVYVDEGIPVVSPGDTTPGRLNLSRCNRFVDAADFKDLTAGGRRPQQGDIIYSRNASVGIASYVDTDKPFCMGQDVCLIRSSDQDQRFLTLALNTFGLDQLELTKVGSTFTRVNVAQISELRVPCPPVEVQRNVADCLDRSAATAGQIIERLYRQLALLQEHRQALIAAAVIGQIDIPGVAA